MLKGKVARSNLTLKKKDVKKLTEDAFESISPEDWASCCWHVKDVEKWFYALDIAVDDQVDRLVITVTSSDEDTASDCDGGSTDDEKQTRRVGDMKRLEISLLYYFVDCD